MQIETIFLTHGAAGYLSLYPDISLSVLGVIQILTEPKIDETAEIVILASSRTTIFAHIVTALEKYLERIELFIDGISAEGPSKGNLTKQAMASACHWANLARKAIKEMHGVCRRLQSFGEKAWIKETWKKNAPNMDDSYGQDEFV